MRRLIKGRLARDEEGVASVEWVILAPLVVLFMVFAVFLGRLVQAHQDLDAAAKAAARAASQVQDLALANQVATQAAQAALSAHHVSCAGGSTTLDASDLRPGGHVVARVTCQVHLAGLGLLGVGGTRAMAASFSAPVDPYQGFGP